MSDQKNTHGHEDADILGNENSISSLPSFAPREAVKAQQALLEQEAAAVHATPANNDPTVENAVAPLSVNADAGKEQAGAATESVVSPVAADGLATKDQQHDVADAMGEPKVEVAVVEPEAASVVVVETPAPAPAQESATAAFVSAVDEPVFDPALAALRAVAGKINAVSEASTPSLNGDELARVAERLNLMGSISDPGAAQAVAESQLVPGAGVAAVPVSGGQRAQVNGAASLAEGVGMAIGGAMSLVGAAGRTIGHVAKSVAALAPSDEKSVAKALADVEIAKAGVSAALPSVLPRLSEYRILQAEKAADAFVAEQDKFWGASPKLSALRDEIERIARERGVPKQDLLEGMKPGGDLAELRTQFNEAVAGNPDAMSHKRSMDKALDSYVRQFGRAQEEMLNPEQLGNPHYEGLKKRLNGTHEKMEESASGVPAFAKADGALDDSHLDKLREAVSKIMEKIREVIAEFAKMLSGKREADHAPAP